MVGGRPAHGDHTGGLVVDNRAVLVDREAGRPVDFIAPRGVTQTGHPEASLELQGLFRRPRLTRNASNKLVSGYPEEFSSPDRDSPIEDPLVLGEQLQVRQAIQACLRLATGHRQHEEVVL